MLLLFKRNILENLIIVATCGTFICVLLIYVTNVSIISRAWFPFYLLYLFIASVLVSFKCIQRLLRKDRPLKYDFNVVVKRYPYLTFFKQFLPKVRRRVPYEWKEYDTNDLSVISTVLERNLVSSWYLPYVSQEIGFPFACKQLLDQMIGKAFTICHKMETKDVFVDMCAIMITHLKEYKMALKWKEMRPNRTIESLYKTSHRISDLNTKYTSADHCTNILRIIIKELLPCELWDTPHSELLVRILSKKLDLYIENTLADPAWLNDRLVTFLTGEEYVESVKTENTEKEVTNELVNNKEPIVESVVQTVDTPQELNDQENIAKIESIVEEQAVNATLPLDVKSSPVLRQKRGRQGRNEVKIYDRVIEGSVKTWETDMDLQCISLGQDLLASLDGEITLSRLWGQDGEAESSPERQGGKSPQPLWFGEEEALELEVPRREHSPKAADVLKELHTTVSNAKTKIGDLQVRPTEPCRGDEAAGMMEGLLDFGIAGLKKGLRFTGLSDDSQDKSPSHREKSNRSSPEARNKVYPEPGTSPLSHKESDIGNGAAPHLVKQHRVISQDSVPLAPVAPPCDSPEPQYEEAADLSSSIAKLRCLLRQRAEPISTTREEEIWWEGAEETRGRTQLHHSSRPVDAAALADEYDMSMDRTLSPNQTSNNNMQRLDKLFQRTVTGVFNSLKTAVGGEEECEEGAPPPPAPAWSYVCGARDLGAAALLARAARAPRPRPAARAAPRAAPQRRNLHDTHAEWCGAATPAWSGVLGVATAALPTPHSAARLASLLFAEMAESVITWWLQELAGRARRAAFEGRGAGGAGTRPLHAGFTVQLLLDRLIPLQLVLGKETVRSLVSVMVSSLSHRDINRDVAHRTLDLLALHFVTANAAAGVPQDVTSNNGTQ